ncbi:MULTISPECIES: holo-ACP synthase AcpS [Trueperella]|uniref:holo-ACP synthase AcpS n=1 Tax=Trueperella TaxID=1069494 RepID=UPI000839714A|nr:MULTISPECIES: holo-ACP synthase [Trueperella]MCM3907431.1 holo-ACP synthase [Trueperella bernardiae]OCW61227.1 hypothetical protein AKG36_02095 [Trueperella bernardiae]OFS68774.1 hypothetical protein HMPREF3174_00245 [Trueperella sp. HMSC08H06]OFS76417.1 hypothetical protein HMPREF3167_00960 [Trueperella sp. HMSC08B05]PKZ89651.1 holo-ACP synthase [Trueperella bernardiae]
MPSGLGVDLVHIPTFAEQLAAPGTHMAQVFSGAEMRGARRRAAATGADVAHHLAARWAGKEAFIKAWSSTLVGRPPLIAEQDVNLTEIQVLSDPYHRPYIALTSAIKEAFGDTDILLSLSHDGDYAIAVCQISTKNKEYS